MLQIGSRFSRAHCVIRFTDSNGNISGCRGGPTGRGNSSGAGGSSGSSGSGSGNQQSSHCRGCCGSWGNIVAGCGTGAQNSTDPLQSGLWTDLEDARNNPSHCRVVAQSAAACSVQSCVANQMQQITSRCYIYRPSGPNSNTAWHNALSACGYNYNPPRIQPGLGTNLSGADTCLR